eukprot:CAMPEP_0172556510 /NCGR_PEP_ID=MMETSP1067-20121228/66786_1 /TAXON_ID=265564 ORGANISM="Thalassiosira punctigera, Strain Tpunct2005C2" /NCGR_SAMPLE_ID=MMETSP1067 /ASSEMBLY_ACC=CAM_ASM_000444 /LENGTH=51 /DNA_ID=CAMNT_0013345347 /DNA_START=379 /DNA_END=531 /DNA_ORIENTATION=-
MCTNLSSRAQGALMHDGTYYAERKRKLLPQKFHSRPPIVPEGPTAAPSRGA